MKCNNKHCYWKMKCNNKHCYWNMKGICVSENLEPITENRKGLNMINLLGEKELNDYIIHKVVKGESLYSIAKKYYGKGWLWRIIYFDNKEIIGCNPDLIKEEMNLFIDKKYIK